MQKVFRITVDISKKIPAPAFEVNTNDLKSVKLEITITNGQSLLDLTDVTPRINIRKPDNEVIFQDCEIVDATAGKVQIVLENQAYLVPGTHTAEIACYKGNEITAITGTFSYKSVKGIMNDAAVESRSEFTAIDRKIAEARKLLEDAAESGVGVDEQARQEIQEVSAQLADTAKKSDIQQLSLTFKESYATLSALQAAYPNGNNANHVVLADNMIYTYKNGWVSTEIQANGTGIPDNTVTDSMLNSALLEKFNNMDSNVNLSINANAETVAHKHTLQIPFTSKGNMKAGKYYLIAKGRLKDTSDISRLNIYNTLYYRSSSSGFTTLGTSEANGMVKSFQYRPSQNYNDLNFEVVSYIEITKDMINSIPDTVSFEFHHQLFITNVTDIGGATASSSNPVSIPISLEYSYMIPCDDSSLGKVKDLINMFNSHLPALPYINWKKTDIQSLLNKENKVLDYWGDSLTQGTGGNGTSRPSVMQSLLGSGWKVNNRGTGGEQSNTIAARQGGMSFVAQPSFTIPPDRTPVTVTITDNNGDAVNIRGTTDDRGINPCYINGVKGRLNSTYTADQNPVYTYTFTRETEGNAVVIDRPTTIITNAMNTLRDNPVVILIGQNGGYNGVPNELVEQIKHMIDFNNTKKYLVISLTSPGKESQNEAMKKAFGRHFVDARSYLIQYGLSDAGITPTADDTKAIGENKIPPSLLSDSVHLNSYGYTITANLEYKRGKELGYW